MRPFVRLLSLAALSFAVVAPEVAHAQDEVTPSEAAAEPPLGVSASRAQMGLGARVRYVFMPQAVLNLFLDHSTSMSHVLGGVGAEIVRRKGDLDIVFGVEYDYIQPQNGLYLEKGDVPTGDCWTAGTCPDFVEFNGFSILGADLSLIWNANLAERVAFRYGAGIGIAAVLGDLKRTPTTTCTTTDLDDPSVCALTTDPMEIKEGSDAGVPPVVPIVNLLLGFRFKLSDEMTLNLEGGFRDVFFVGLGGDYVF